jgi:hypothetical protein
MLSIKEIWLQQAIRNMGAMVKGQKGILLFDCKTRLSMEGHR